MNGYQLLANAIVQQAAEDYFNILAGFDVSPPPKAYRDALTKRSWSSSSIVNTTDF